MADFRTDSKEFLESVSRAAAWMMKRNVGAESHWWKAWVLTPRHTADPDPQRPVVDDATARKIFDELLKRNLLDDKGPDGGAFVSDEPEYPVYRMRQDVEGWDKAVSDGRPLYGQCLKFIRTWPLIIGAFIGGVIVDKAVDTAWDSAKAKWEAAGKTEAKPPAQIKGEPSVAPIIRAGPPNKPSPKPESKTR